MRGDRPRWRDASAWLADAAGVKDGVNDGPQIFANVPGVVAYYLGVPAAETMGHPLVKPPPQAPVAVHGVSRVWRVAAIAGFALFLAAAVVLAAQFSMTRSRRAAARA